PNIPGTIDEHPNWRRRHEVPADDLAEPYAKAGLREPNKPVGSYLFVGPTGVGKTELAKSLAKHTTGSEENIIRIDMSEYMEKHTVGKLVGAPPGYVGHGEEGVLTGAVRRNPNAIVVFDEIEKAHPDVQKLLLGVMDDGKMKDGRGRDINFQNATLVMTSNLGAAKANAEADKTPIGFGNNQPKEVDRGQIMQKEVEAFFAPEFIGRLDGIVAFNELDKDVASLILDAQIKKLAERTKASWGVALELGEKVRDTLLKEGFNPRLGARPLKQAIDKLVGKPLSKWLLKTGTDNLRSGMNVTVTEVGSKFTVEAPGADGGDLIVNPKRIVKPDGDLPGDAHARLSKWRRDDSAPANDPKPEAKRHAPGMGRR
ncbi:MAG: AAA family ATPase, partial [Pseudomonadota bacterium]